MRENTKHIDRRTLLKTASGAGLTITAGCLTGSGGNGDDGDTGNGNGGDTDGEEIVIGALQPYSGPFAIYSEAHQAGLEFAVNEVNDDGGVLGRQLSISDADTSAEASEAATIYSQMVDEEEIIAATGPVSSDVAIRVGESADDEEVPLLFHAGASNEALNKDSSYRFRVGALPAASTVKAQAGLMEDRGYTEVGSVIADYAFGESVRTSIERFYPSNADMSFGTAPVGASDFTPYLREFENIQALVGTGHPPGLVDMYNQSLEIELDYDVFLGSTAPDIAYYNSLGEDVTQGFSFFHQADVYSDEFQEIGQRFADARGEYFGTTHAVGYVTGKLIAAALEEAGEADPAALSEALRGISFDTIYANPIEYTDWGELENQIQIWSQIELESPEYFSDGEFRLTELYRSDPIEAFDPAEF